MAALADYLSRESMSQKPLLFFSLVVVAVLRLHHDGGMGLYGVAPLKGLFKGNV